MKNARNTSRQFRAIAHIRAKIEAQVEADRLATGVSRKPVCNAAIRYGRAMLAAGVTPGAVLAVLRPMWRDAHRRPPRVSNYMTSKEAARYQKRQEWAAKQEARNHNRAERLWKKYGRVCPYEEA